MTVGIRRLLCFLSLCGLVVACGGGGPSRSLSVAIRVPAASVGDLALPEATPSSTPYAFKAKPGGLLLVYFGYTSCPDVCPTTLAGIRTALRSIGQDASRIDLAMITIDPARDTASKLSAYVASFVSGAHGLRTDDQTSLQRVADAFGASYSVTVDPSGVEEVSHTAFVCAVNETGQMFAQWAFGAQPSDMAHDMRALLADPSGQEPAG